MLTFSVCTDEWTLQINSIIYIKIGWYEICIISKLLKLTLTATRKPWKGRKKGKMNRLCGEGDDVHMERMNVWHYVRKKKAESVERYEAISCHITQSGKLQHFLSSYYKWQTFGWWTLAMRKEDRNGYCCLFTMTLWPEKHDKALEWRPSILIPKQVIVFLTGKFLELWGSGLWGVFEKSMRSH